MLAFLPFPAALFVNLTFYDGQCKTLPGRFLLPYLVAMTGYLTNSCFDIHVRCRRTRNFIPLASLTVAVLCGMSFQVLCDAPS